VPAYLEWDSGELNITISAFRSDHFIFGFMGTSLYHSLNDIQHYVRSCERVAVSKVFENCFEGNLVYIYFKVIISIQAILKQV